MTEKQERRRHRLATGIFNQPEEPPRPCCTRCGEYLKPDRVPTGELCGLCYDDQRNGR